MYYINTYLIVKDKREIQREENINLSFKPMMREANETQTPTHNS